MMRGCFTTAQIAVTTESSERSIGICVLTYALLATAHRHTLGSISAVSAGRYPGVG